MMARKARDNNVQTMYMLHTMYEYYDEYINYC